MNTVDGRDGRSVEAGASAPRWRDGRIKLPPELMQRARELRAAHTPAEELLWELLRDRRLGGVKFRRQHVIDAYVADFYCHAARLVIELDGSIHQHQGLEDQRRQDRLEFLGYHVLRFTNEAIHQDLELTLAQILEAATLFPPHLTPLSRGERGGG